MYKRLIVGVIAGAAITTVFVGSLHATAGHHNTSGTSGSHQPITHPFNPGHIWASIHADHQGAVTSGGRYHDNCGVTVCNGAFAPSDWAVDIGGGGGATSRLYLDYAGNGSGASPIVNNNFDITITARVVAQGNFRATQSPPNGDPACDYRKLEVRATWIDTQGGFHSNDIIGVLYVAHVSNWQHGVGSVIPANASRPNLFGGGTVHYVNAAALGTVYNGKGTVTNSFGNVCSTGPHSHLEYYSNHAWGGEFEWHSISGPDGYNNLAGYSNHIHGNGTSGSTGYSGDSVGQGQQLGWLGGDRTSFFMFNNPNYSDH